MEKTFHVRNEAQFNRITASGAVLVAFCAQWCMPCRNQLAILESMLEERQLPLTLTTARVDVDAAPALAKRFAIAAIPTLILFREGRVAKRFTGVQTPETLLAAVAEPAAVPR